jgi:hypothetical protein
MTGMRTKKRSTIRVLIQFLILLAFLCSTVSAAEINSHFRSVNTAIKGETTFYSYLKQSDLKESGYARGLETGSLNYFKGNSATIDDTQVYYDGTVDYLHAKDSLNHNSTVNHILKVDYTGEKGLSLFYAKGFYTDNRAAAASKKIWYGNTSYYPTNHIEVDGSVWLDMGGTYDMVYRAKAVNSYFVFNDVSGKSNKTGSRRIDFEQEGLIKGIIDVINDFSVQNAFIPREGPIYDWIPCFCFTGTLPKIEPSEGEYSVWPSNEIKANLNDPPLPASILDNTACKYGNASPQAGLIVELQDVQVESFYTKTVSSGDPLFSIYEFTTKVRDTGTNELENVRLVAQIGIEDKKTLYVESSGRIDNGRTDPNRVSNGLMWTLGTLKPVSGPDGEKTVVMKINSSEAIEDTAKFYAIYKIGNEDTSTVPVGLQRAVSVEES